MITAEELVLELNNIEENKNFKLATVVDLFNNETAKIKFDGEDIPSEKQYAYLKSYIPEIGDRVLLATLGGTYIILGKVNYNVSPQSEGEEVDRYIYDLKTVSILKGLQVSGAATFNNGATIVGNIGINGSLTATSISSTGVISGASLSVPGNVGGGAGSFSSLSSSGEASIAGTLSARGMFTHRGSQLGFFNREPRSMIHVGTYVTNTPDLNAVKNKLNALIQALINYGLIT